MSERTLLFEQADLEASTRSAQRPRPLTRHLTVDLLRRPVEGEDRVSRSRAIILLVAGLLICTVGVAVNYMEIGGDIERDAGLGVIVPRGDANVVVPSPSAVPEAPATAAPETTATVTDQTSSTAPVEPSVAEGAASQDAAPADAAEPPSAEVFIPPPDDTVLPLPDEAVPPSSAPSVAVTEIVPLTAAAANQASPLLALAFAAAGLLLAATQIMALGYVRRFVVGNRYVTVLTRSFGGHIARFMEAIGNYTGVRYRIRIIQSGMRPRIQHIVELQHEDEARTLPLFVQMNGEGMRHRWEEAARSFGLPAVLDTADGLVERDIADFDKALRHLVLEGKVKLDFDPEASAPHSISVQSRGDRIHISPRRRDGHFSGRAVFTSVTAFFLLAFTLFVNTVRLGISPQLTLVLLAVSGVILLVFPLAMFFRRQRIVIGGNELRHGPSWLGVTGLLSALPYNEIEAIDVFQSSYDHKYFLLVNALNNVVILGRGLPYEDLKWLRGYLIRSITV